VSHKSFEDLEDITLLERGQASCGESGGTGEMTMDAESLIQDTLAMSSADDEEWRQ